MTMSRRVDDHEWAMLKRNLRRRIDARIAAERRGTLDPRAEREGSED
jgi:hypothetical protein